MSSAPPQKAGGKGKNDPDFFRRLADLYQSEQIRALAECDGLRNTVLLAGIFRQIQGLKMVGMRGAHLTLHTVYFYAAARMRVAGSSRVAAESGSRSSFDARQFGDEVHLDLERWFKRKRPRRDRPLHEAAQRAIHVMTNLGLRPAGAELLLSDPISRVGTACDGLAWDERNRRLVLLEFKTGSDLSFTTSQLGKVCEPPFERGIMLTELVKAKLQLLLCRQILCDAYGVAVDACFVVHIPRQPRNPVRLYELEPGLVELGAGMLAQIRHADAGRLNAAATADFYEQRGQFKARRGGDAAESEDTVERRPGRKAKQKPAKQPKASALKATETRRRNEARRMNDALQNLDKLLDAGEDD